MNKIPPHESAFNKRYLLNLLSDTNRKSHFFIDGEMNNPVIYKMINKLSPVEVKTLIDKIENLM